MKRKRFLRAKRQQPGKCVVVMNHKGGTGKSTSVELTSQFIASETGESPLLVDFDPQMNLSSAFKYIPEFFPHNIEQAIMPNPAGWEPSQVERSTCGVKATGVGTRFFLIPGSHGLDGAISYLRENSARSLTPVELRLRDIASVGKDYFEYVWVDTSPALSNFMSDMTLWAADIVAIPVSDLRSVLGLVRVFEALKKHAGLREREGLDSPQVIIYCPHMIEGSQALVTPHGPYGVRNDDWYPLLCSLFPNHFVKMVVPHSKTVARSFEQNWGIRALTGSPRSRYKSLATRLHEKFQDPDLEHLDVTNFDVEALRSSVLSLLKKTEKNMTSLHPVKFLEEDYANVTFKSTSSLVVPF